MKVPPPTRLWQHLQYIGADDRRRVTGNCALDSEENRAVRRFECSDLTVQIVMKGLSEVHQQETEVSTPV
jgi:hypothetical protein